MSAGLIGACALLGSCLLASQPAHAQDCRDLSTRRAKDSCAIKTMCLTADALIQTGTQALTGDQVKQMKQTASALDDWAAKYLKPYVAINAVAVRYFKKLILAGRYFEWGNARLKAFKAYKQANLTLLPDSPLRAQADAYAKELTARLQLLDNYYRSRPPANDPVEALRIRASFASVSAEDNANRKVLERQFKQQFAAARRIESRLLDEQIAGTASPATSSKTQPGDSARLATAPLRSTLPSFGIIALSDSARASVPLPKALLGDE